MRGRDRRSLVLPAPPPPFSPRSSSHHHHPLLRPPAPRQSRPISPVPPLCPSITPAIALVAAMQSPSPAGSPAQPTTAHPPRTATTAKRRLSDAHPHHYADYDHHGYDDDDHDDEGELPARSKRSRPGQLNGALGAEIGHGLAGAPSSSAPTQSHKALSPGEKEQRRVARMIRNRSASAFPPRPPLAPPHGRISDPDLGCTASPHRRRPGLARPQEGAHGLPRAALLRAREPPPPQRRRRPAHVRCTAPDRRPGHLGLVVGVGGRSRAAAAPQGRTAEVAARVQRPVGRQPGPHRRPRGRQRQPPRPARP